MEQNSSVGFLEIFEHILNQCQGKFHQTGKLPKQFKSILLLNVQYDKPLVSIYHFWHQDLSLPSQHLSWLNSNWNIMISSCHLFNVLIHFTCLYPSGRNLLDLSKHFEYFGQSKDKSKNVCFGKITVPWWSTTITNTQYLIICVHDKALNVVYVLVSDGVSCPDEVDYFGKIVTVFSLFYFCKLIILRWPRNGEKVIFSLFM